MSETALNRWKWPAPSEEGLGRRFLNVPADVASGKAERLRFLLQEFGPPAAMWFYGGFPSYRAMEELQRTFVEGHFLSTILTAQVFIEVEIGGAYIVAMKDKVAESGLSGIIKHAEDNGEIDAPLAAKLRDLHGLRIAYGHSHLGSNKRGFLQRLLASSEQSADLLEADARQAICVVADFLRFVRPSCRPDNPDWEEVLRTEFEGAGLSL